MTDPEEESDEYWEERFRRATQTAPLYKSVADLRDTVDPGWRARQRMREAPPEGLPSRTLPETLGRVGGREYRQVNVKLGAADFEMLTSLAVQRDLAPATLSRVLLRNAIRRLAEGNGF